MNSQINSTSVSCSFDDLRDENRELRKERQELYGMVHSLEARSSQENITSFTLRIKELSAELIAAKDQMRVQVEHNTRQAQRMRDIVAQQKLEEQECRHIKIQVLEVLPMRMKLNQIKLKYDQACVDLRSCRQDLEEVQQSQKSSQAQNQRMTAELEQSQGIVAKLELQLKSPTIDISGFIVLFYLPCCFTAVLLSPSLLISLC